MTILSAVEGCSLDDYEAMVNKVLELIGLLGGSVHRTQSQARPQYYAVSISKFPVRPRFFARSFVRARQQMPENTATTGLSKNAEALLSSYRP